MSRAGTTLMQKTGQVERTIDSEFNSTEEQYRTVEREVLALQEAKAYLDAMRSLASSQARIAEAPCPPTPTVAPSTSSTPKPPKKSTPPYRATVLEPVGKLASYFPEINKILDKRAKKLLDYDAARSKHRKLVDKPSDDPSKLPEQKRTRRRTHRLRNPRRPDQDRASPARRPAHPYLDPSFEAMVRIQAKFARGRYADGQLDNQVEAVLPEMRELSICGVGQSTCLPSINLNSAPDNCDTAAASLANETA
ncbi:putative Reduced viability upon starvation protein 161 (putative) [Pseudozyma hubeiensis]|nr:putative Reduced viability upon starvation protein 161 (putative) [Pseudozyma hubeiensis]